ncbi:MAG: glycosyltransferase family 2 protein [Methanotrichaceae archaeon]
MSPSLVSIIMSVYNEENYLKETIDSILNQTFQNFEFIIVDDGSTDDTAKILNEYKEADRRIKIVTNQENIGIAGSTNRGIKCAIGKYVAIMDSGDLAHPKRLERQVNFLQSHDDVFILGTQGIWIAEDGRRIGSYRMPLMVDSKALYGAGGAIHPSIMARKALFDIIGFYDEKLVMSQEFDLYMRCLERNLGMANLDEELISIREREKGMTLAHLKTIQRNQLKIKIKYLPRFIGIWNVFYTLRSFGGYILPSFMLSRIAKSGRRAR